MNITSTEFFELIANKCFYIIRFNSENYLNSILAVFVYMVKIDLTVF